MIAYTIAIHIPLLQGEPVSFAAIRRDEDTRVVKVDEVRGRDFYGDVMLEMAAMAQRLAIHDKETAAYCHLVFSGQGFGHAEIDAMMATDWRAEAYSYVTVSTGAELAKLVTDDVSLPLNHFRVSRQSLIQAISFAYHNPRTIYFMLDGKQADALTDQMSAFAQRAATIPANDPEAIMEYKGEGRVIALGVALWYLTNAQRVRSGWAKELVA